MKGAGALAAASVVGMPYIRDAKAATLELRRLGWEHYNVKSIVSGFEKEYGVKVSSGFFDGNSEAYNKLKAGGTTTSWRRSSARAAPSPAGDPLRIHLRRLTGIGKDVLRDQLRRHGVQIASEFAIEFAELGPEHLVAE